MHWDIRLRRASCVVVRMRRWLWLHTNLRWCIMIRLFRWLIHIRLLHYLTLCLLSIVSLLIIWLTGSFAISVMLRYVKWRFLHFHLPIVVFMALLLPHLVMRMIYSWLVVIVPHILGLLMHVFGTASIRHVILFNRMIVIDVLPTNIRLSVRISTRTKLLDLHLLPAFKNLNIDLLRWVSRRRMDLLEMRIIWWLHIVRMDERIGFSPINCFVLGVYLVVSSLLNFV